MIQNSRPLSDGIETGSGAIPLSLRTKTTLAQRLPYDLENKILQFHRFVIAARQRMQYPLAKTFNMDETPMQFELPSSPLLLQKSITKLQYIHSLGLYVNKYQFPNVGESLFSKNSRPNPLLWPKFYLNLA